MNSGAVVIDGPPEEVINPELLSTVFRVRTHVIAHPESGRPHVITGGRCSG